MWRANKVILSFCIFWVFTVFSKPADSQTTSDVAGKIGVGFSGIGFNLSHTGFLLDITESCSDIIELAPLEGISVRYWTPYDISIEGVFGFLGYGLIPEATVVKFGGRLLYNVKKEEKLNTHVGVEFGFIRSSYFTRRECSGVQGGMLLGIEFFPTSNLGFEMNVGFEMSYNDGLMSYSTVGDLLRTASFHYYF